MRLLFAVCALGAFSSLALAQTSSIVIPNGMAATEGSTSNAFPWGRGGTGLRIQTIYDSSHFLNQGVNYPILISSLRWRPNTGVALVASSYTAGCTVKLSTCPLDQAAASTTMASNQGADLTTCYSGVVSWGAQAAQTGPTPFGIVVPFTTNFLYDPNQGDLNIECDLPVQTFTGGGPQLDVHSTSPLACRVYISTGYPGTGVGTITANHGVVVQVDFSPAGSGTVARSTSYGTGCYAKSASYYENFATSAAFDLANTAFSMLNSGGSYAVLPGLSTYVPPSPSAVALALTDDSETSVALTMPFPHATGVTSSLTVCSNGFVSVATGNGTGFTPAPATMLNAPQTGWWAQHDYNPAAAGSGSVKFEQIGAMAYVTWDGVYNYGGTTAADANTFQFQFDCATGNVGIVFQSMSAAGNARMVGYSPGGASLDPGSIDLSAALATGFVLPGLDQAPLALAMPTRPLIGSTVQFVTSNLLPSSPFGATMLGFTQVNPGFDLSPLGAPGCFQYLSPSVTQVFLAAGGLGSTSLAIPGAPGFIGLRLLAQSAAFDASQNSLGVVTSNGLDLQTGNL